MPGSPACTVSDELATQIGESVARLSRRLRAGSARLLAPFGLTDAQARALRMVGRNRVPLRMSEIARRIQIVPRSATTIIEGLEAKGLVVREIDPEDRRSTLVRMTETGTRLYSEIGRARDTAAVELFSRLPPTDQAALRALLGTVEATDGQLGAGAIAGSAGKRTKARRR
jgi:DNA-binding MarR family transcriptional regulator